MTSAERVLAGLARLDTAEGTEAEQAREFTWTRADADASVAARRLASVAGLSSSTLGELDELVARRTPWDAYPNWPAILDRYRLVPSIRRGLPGANRSAARARARRRIYGADRASTEHEAALLPASHIMSWRAWHLFANVLGTYAEPELLNTPRAAHELGAHPLDRDRPDWRTHPKKLPAAHYPWAAGVYQQLAGVYQQSAGVYQQPAAVYRPRQLRRPRFIDDPFD
jgi:hypothetical protein